VEKHHEGYAFASKWSGMEGREWRKGENLGKCLAATAPSLVDSSSSFNSPHNARVSTLIDPLSGWWNLDLVRSLFDQGDVDIA